MSLEEKDPPTFPKVKLVLDLSDKVFIFIVIVTCLILLGGSLGGALIVNGKGIKFGPKKL